MFRVVVVAAACLFGAACNDSASYTPPGPLPRIVSVAGPQGSVLRCSPADAGGDCPLSIAVTFRLDDKSFVTKAYVRFQGDGSDDGVDRAYVLAPTYGAGPDKDVVITVDAGIPPDILRTGALFTYSVRLVTGLGDESAATKLNVSVQ